MRHRKIIGGRAAAALFVTGSLVAAGLATTIPASAAPAAAARVDNSAGGIHNLSTPWGDKQNALREEALKQRLQGVPAAQGKVAKVGASSKVKGKAANKGNYVQLEREGTDKIFVVLADFGNTRHASYPDTNPDGTPASDATRFTGPRNNQIPQPDRSRDNSTLWQADYNKAHYQDMYFNRMADYYQTQSSGRYSVEGAVTEWVKVPFNEARYGRDYCGSIVCNNTWFLLRDAMAIWTQDQLDSGMTMAEITDYLKTFDVQDRYDIDGDGNFAEPDGFIDHFQIVHAGGDQAAGDPTYNSDAIWSHRWYAQISAGGPGGLPGINIGQGGVSSTVTLPDNPTGVWVGDYTIQPENGGLGVFAHEFGHDLGLPDLYDTSGNTGGAENSTAFWTLMSSGANIGDGGPDGIGDAPTDFGAWELFQLGWLQPQGRKGPFYDVAEAGQRSTHTLKKNTPAVRDSVQALFVLLPDKETTSSLGSAASGDFFYYSDQGNDLNNTMSLTEGVSGTDLTAKVSYDIEEAYDFAFLEASSDGGSTWQAVQTNLSSPASEDQSGNNSSGTGITGTSDGYVDLTATLPAGTNGLRFRYQTDPAAVGTGLQVDDVTVDGTLVGGAEVDEGWQFDGFFRTDGEITTTAFNAYIAENRQYDGYDASLKTAYNFGWTNSNPDKVENYRYQNGLLINYWDTTFADNNVGDHPGGGLVLPVDAHPTFFHAYDGTLLRPRALSFDSTFGLEKTDKIVYHTRGRPTFIPNQKAVPTFDDTKTWWYDDDGDGATGSHVGRYQPGWNGVDVPKTGTTIKVAASTTFGRTLTVKVAPKASR